MSPRRNRSSRPDRGRGRPPDPGWDPERARRGVDTVETWGRESYRVRHIPGGAAGKTYRCPGCAQEISPGVPHVVAWPESGLAGFGGEADRRHWHTGCWRARDRRRPTG
ncbi:hypothetical protein JQS43_05975 [Natronosporangium hydrolyticum]|uniref:ATP/GTP-binding protein n=1 Tax=Natronosporangium hydrolyticum TaxID=2811111 RepID=A0A895YK50_9ACTN|nr:hypothetical protein [Natronosporangium hydrolyticum]QSB15879.1 hypothetical protein JQS43_05975 [Natronosporangium hydrolyticum]